MKFLLPSSRFGLLASLAVGLAFPPLSALRADDHGGGGEAEPEDHGKTDFLGTIQTLPATADLTGIWTVDGRAVTVDASTLVHADHGSPAVGGHVEVEGTLLAVGAIGQGSVLQTEDAERELEDNVFFGTIQALPAAGTPTTSR